MELLSKKYHLKCELKKYHSKQTNNGNLCFQNNIDQRIET